MFRRSRLIALAFVATGAATLVPVVAAPQAQAAADLSCWTKGAYLYSYGYGQKAVCNTFHTATVGLYRNGVYVDHYRWQSRLTSSANFLTSSVKIFPLQCGPNYQVKVWLDNDLKPGDTIFHTSGAPRRVC